MVIIFILRKSRFKSTQKNKNRNNKQSYHDLNNKWLNQYQNFDRVISNKYYQERENTYGDKLKYCEYCGQKLDLDANFCTMCGMKLKFLNNI